MRDRDFLLFIFFQEKYFKIVTLAYRVEKLKLNMQETSHTVPRLLPVKRDVLVCPAERCRSPWEVQKSPSKFLTATTRSQAWDTRVVAGWALRDFRQPD